MNIVVIGTLDTKGPEVGYLRDEVTKRGARPLVIDPGILGEPAIPADVTRQQVAQAAGVELAELVASGDKQLCQQAMIDGLVAVVTRLLRRGPGSTAWWASVAPRARPWPRRPCAPCLWASPR